MPEEMKTREQLLHELKKTHHRIVELEKSEIQHQKREEVLRKANDVCKGLQDVINQSPAIVFLWRAVEGWPVDLVTNNIRHFGYTPDDFYSGRVPYLDIIHPDDLLRVADEVASYSQEEGRKSFKQEYRIITKGGDVRWTEDRTSIKRDDNGKITHYQGIVLDITKRKEMGKALEESEAEYRTIFEHTGTATVIIDEDTTLSLVNTEFEKISGYLKDELEGKKSWTDFVVAEDLEKMKEYHQLRRSDPDLAPENYEFQFIDRNKNIKNILLTVTVFPDTKKSVASLLDITDRKKAELKVLESEERTRRLLRKSFNAWVIHAGGELLDSNPAAIKIMGGKKTEDFIGKPLADFIHPDYKDAVSKRTMKMYTTGGTVPLIEEKWLKLDGTPIDVEVVATSFNYEGKPAVQVAFRDITQRKKSEESIKEQYDFLQRLIDTIPSPLFYKDVNYVYLGCNKYFEEFIGLSKDEIIGKTVYEIAPKELADKYHQSDKELIERDPIQIYEAPVRYADGSRHAVIFNKSTFNDSDGNVAGLIGVMVDITQRKMAEEELKKSVKEKEMLLKEIHHRVKNNLMVISSLLNLQSTFIKDKEALDIFRESQSRAKSMALIHERLYQSTDLKRINFGDYIRTLATDLFHTYVADPSAVKLNLDVDDLMLDINTTVPLGLIVNELVSNCMKHAFPDSQTGEVNIDFHKISDDYVLKVYDTGVGFPEDLDFRNTKTLGLQLVNNLVGQVDGTIELDRSHGTGFAIKFKELEL